MHATKVFQMNSTGVIDIHKPLNLFITITFIYTLKLNTLIIILINFYGAYILRNLSSEVQQNGIIKHNREQGHA